MRSLHVCEPCGFSTDRRKLYVRHTTTLRHQARTRVRGVRSPPGSPVQPETDPVAEQDEHDTDGVTGLFFPEDNAGADYEGDDVDNDLLAELDNELLADLFPEEDLIGNMSSCLFQTLCLRPRVCVCVYHIEQAPKRLKWHNGPFAPYPSKLFAILHLHVVFSHEVKNRQKCNVLFEWCFR